MATIGLRPELQRLADHELGLRHRPLGRVDQHDDAVDHVQDALHLAAEVGVAGRVDDVDARVLPLHRGALGQDGDAALALQVVGVHGALGDLLVLAEGAGLRQQLVDEGGLAMVDVCDDRDIAQVHWSEAFSSAKSPAHGPGAQFVAAQYHVGGGGAMTEWVRSIADAPRHSGAASMTPGNGPRLNADYRDWRRLMARRCPPPGPTLPPQASKPWPEDDAYKLAGRPWL